MFTVHYLSVSEPSAQPRSFKQESFVPFVMDAVYAAAHAIEKLLQDRCGPGYTRSCALNAPLEGFRLMNHIRNLSFMSKQSISTIGCTLKMGNFCERLYLMLYLTYLSVN